MFLNELISFLTENEISYSFSTSSDALESLQIEQIASLASAQSQHISFFSDLKRQSELKQTRAALVLIKSEHAQLCPVPCLIVDSPYMVYALLTQELNPRSGHIGIASTAVIHSSASLGQNVSIGHHVVVDENVYIGDGCVISHGCVISQDVSIGKNSYLYPNVTIMHKCQLGQSVTIQSGSVVGGEGFGYAPHQGKWIAIPQIGRVIIGNHVAIGNNVAIDRGALEDTIIADDCIIDNLVHISHNTQIGEGSALAAQVGFAGGTTVGKHCIFAGQVGVAGHITLADGVALMAKAGVTNTIKESGSYSGFPAIPTSEWQKNTIRQRKIGKMATQIKQLTQQLNELTALQNLEPHA